MEMAVKKLGLAPLIHETATVQDCSLGRYTEVGARTSMIETSLGDYSYVVNDGEIIAISVVLTSCLKISDAKRW